MSYPNPFSNYSTIEFMLKNDGIISIYITDALGQRVASLINDEFYTKGGHVLNYNGSDLSNGKYICVLETNDAKKTFNMIKEK